MGDGNFNYWVLIFLAIIYRMVYMYAYICLQVINMDWGNFNSRHLPITEFDKCLDAESSNPGSRVWELFKFFRCFSLDAFSAFYL